MTLRVGLHHETSYQYDRPVHLGPQLVRLRPAPHCRTPVVAYSCRVFPEKHFINWQQDPYGNYLARLVFPERVSSFRVIVELQAEMTVINPFDFFLEESAANYPFAYESELAHDLRPYLRHDQSGAPLVEYLAGIDVRARRTIDFLVDVNRQLQHDIRYLIRMEPGVQTCDETLQLRSGSCRDSAWLLVQVLRRLGLAARFVSGYLIQLKPDVPSLDGPSGTSHDFTDLHAWAEVYLPGAGWVGLDPTSGLLTGEGHLPVACTPDPQSAAPVAGLVDDCETQFHFKMELTRLHEDPRVTLPYSDQQWQEIASTGHAVDALLEQHDVRLTMGGEPTFVSIDDMEGAEWNTEAVGPTKRVRATQLIQRLKNRFAPGGLLHFGQGKWYPGESLPRWSLNCIWRKDGQSVWSDSTLFASPDVSNGQGFVEAKMFALELAERLYVSTQHVIPAFEDAWYYMWRERRLPANVDVRDSRLEDAEERARIARVFEQGLSSPVGCLLPLRRSGWGSERHWESGPWVVRSDELYLVPGDSPMGFRLPLQSLVWETTGTAPLMFRMDPTIRRDALPSYDDMLQRQLQSRTGMAGIPRTRWAQVLQYSGMPTDRSARMQTLETARAGGNGRWTAMDKPSGNGHYPEGVLPIEDEDDASGVFTVPVGQNPSIVRTALCVEPRGGVLHVFMPPVELLEDYLDLVVAIEATAANQSQRVVIEGYLPPEDSRIQHIKVTPDPGVIEVNVHPAANWDELVQITTGVYEDAHYSRLGTEKFHRDGRHTGTGGGNHVVLGGATPGDSPWLRRPDLLKSFVAYWHNHPSLSYLFSSTFIGPTSQAPRVDEGRRDAVYELKIALEQIPDEGKAPPWLVDRVFRHLLVDGTGNTHRAEFCIDKLFSPDGAHGRLGLLEMRAFEMPPHAQMSLAQQLLIRALVARFWQTPYRKTLVDWNTAIHDRFMLPLFVWQDFVDVIEQTQLAGIPLQADWYRSHFEFRFPRIGGFAQRGIEIELRQAIEPWYVLGEEPAAGGTARYVDSSVERMQILVRGMTDTRHIVACNGRQVPLHPTGTIGEFVAGVRYRAWQPPSCLHPTIPVDEPLVLDLVDTWMRRSLGGCRYHVGHPGGLNPEAIPVNAYEAESRRASRFFCMGHTPGPFTEWAADVSSEFPLTLDLRRGKTCRR